MRPKSSSRIDEIATCRVPKVRLALAGSVSPLRWLAPLGLAGWVMWTGMAFAEASSGRVDSCRRIPAAEIALVPTDAAGEAMLRGNVALRAGRAAEALEDYQESARLARASGASLSALLAEANAVRAALATEAAAAVTIRLESLEAAMSDPGVVIPPDFRVRLMIQLARGWQRLAEKSQSEGNAASAARLRAASLFVAAEGLAAESGDERQVSYARGYRGGLYLEAGRLEEARTLTRGALLDADRVAAYDALYRWYAQLSQIERAAGNPSAALAAARGAVKSLALARSGSAAGLDWAGGRFQDEVEVVYLDLVDLLLERAKKRTGAEKQALLGEARDTLEGLKAEEVRDYFEDACLTAQQKVAPDDVPGAVVLYPVLLPDRLELILGREGKLALYSVPIGRDELVGKVRDFRRALPDRTSRTYLRSGRDLYDALIRPIERALAEANVLVVVPSGRLRQIPLAALYDDQERKFLIEKIAVASVPGLTLTDPRPFPAQISRALAAGLSESVQGFVALESVQGEIESVRDAFPSIVLLNKDFSAENFERAIAMNPISVVHIASHGEFSPESSESFVLTYDGQLSMKRLTEAIGRTQLRAEEPLEMLVLSACETAAGDDRSALGLAGVALQSGARSAVATLWSVNDVAAAALIKRFYAEIGQGQSRATALQRAQRSLLADPVFAHPANWSPFLLLSSWL